MDVDNLRTSHAELKARLAEAEADSARGNERLCDLIADYGALKRRLEPGPCGIHPRECWVEEITDKAGWNYDGHIDRYCTVCKQIEDAKNAK